MPQQHEGYAVISAGRQRVRLPVGAAITAGRSSSTDLQIGHSPTDLRVPRLAVRLECRRDGVLIFNTSDKRTITAEVWPGPGFAVPPLSLAGSAPHATVTLVIHGTAGARHTITVDSTRLPGASAHLSGNPSGWDEGDDDADQRTIGYERLTWVTDRQRQLLCALVLPLRFGWRDLAAVPTYAQVVEILAERGIHLSAKHVRNTLDEIRLRTALDHHVDDIHSDGPCSSPEPPSSYLPAFAQWVLVSGTVTDDELAAFDDLAH
ncbi:hypothetical protein SAMN06264364_10431 [Quadrisphaera granulorum]|uniref:Uncharacterized protein n=1 Tax=Quadrisphaera granulorum TaxID=317664 RepID=A0A316ADR4_9ACTN|nr:hypothetical protein [Quadrisphaera granulorum]PWJ55110.1 hypothetical protein BXY45_10431 [Quadrisphaera granulorum]SZE95619.1 hypothetical protein SAMN06264364_10431 [Quadrisphaera granulorum]